MLALERTVRRSKSTPSDVNGLHLISNQLNRLSVSHPQIAQKQRFLDASGNSFRDRSSFVPKLTGFLASRIYHI